MHCCAGANWSTRTFLHVLRLHNSGVAAVAVLLLLADGGRAVRGTGDADLLGDAARNPDICCIGRDPVWDHDGYGISRGWCRWRIPAGVSRPHAQLAADKGGGVPDRENDGDGVLAVCRLRTILRRICVAGWPGIA